MRGHLESPHPPAPRRGGVRIRASLRSLRDGGGLVPLAGQCNPSPLTILDEPAVRDLRTVSAVRERSHELLALAERGALEHFGVDDGRMSAAARLVAAVTRERHPDLRIPLHSRWRHFETPDGVNRWAAAADETKLTGPERARSAVELAIVSALLDAGTGGGWRYRDESTGAAIGRSEGLAAATFDLYRRGALSDDPAHPLRADAAALGRMDLATFARAFQIDDGNRLHGVAGRLRCLRALGRAVAERPEFAGRSARTGGGGGAPSRRLGRLFDFLAAAGPAGCISAHALFGAVLASLRGVIGRALGDVWPHPGIRRPGPTDRLLPLHKLFQWLTWSLIEPLAEGGLEVTGVEALTGLAEYRNGGLLLDTGVLVPLRPLPERALSPGDPIVVEWRGLTVALLDRLRPRVARELGTAESDFSIGQLLEGGTWWAGRRIAADLREGGGPPIRMVSDGTLF